MEQNSPQIPSVRGQPLSVDFIENQLPEIHDAFKNLSIRYDQLQKRFVPDSHTATMPLGRLQLHSHQEGSTPQGHCPRLASATNKFNRVPVRELIPALRAMTFWSKILDKAMAQLIKDNDEVPKRLVGKTEYAIRHLKSWDDIYQRLQMAREKFDGGKSEFIGGVKKLYRRLIDKHDIAQQTLKFVPDVEYVSPVKAAVEVLLDAAKVASKVRTMVGSSFDEKDVEKIFGKIEFFLATFPGDDNITLASVRLMACILKAVEGAIAYYISHTWDRFRQSLPIVGDGSEFQEVLLSGINDIPIKCQELIDEGRNSHMDGTKKALDLVLQGINDITVIESALGNKIESVVENTELILGQGDQILLMINGSKEEITNKQEDLANTIFYFLHEGEVARDMQQAQFMDVLSQMNNKLDKLEVRVHVAEEERDRAKEERDMAIKAFTPTPTPPPQQIPWYPPQQQLPWYPSQQLPGQLPWQLQPPLQERYQSQDLYQQQQQQQQKSGTSSSEPPPALWMGPLPTQYLPHQPPSRSTVHTGDLLGLLKISGLDANDIACILDSSDSIALRYRSQAKGIIITDEFRAWATSPTSCELLIEGDTRRDIIQAGSALSLVAATIARDLRTRDRFASIAFFCREHNESDSEFTGPRSLIRSLSAQLLEQQYFANFAAFWPQNVDWEGVRGGDIGSLCRLFEWLIRQLPQQTTLVCVVDAVEAYETSDYEADLRMVMSSLLSLARDASLLPTFKILVTSHEGTVSLGEEFNRGEMSVLLMERLVANGDEADLLELQDEM